MGHASEIVHKIIRLVDINEYKRKQAPASKPHHSHFGVGRMPIVAKYQKTKFIYESNPKSFLKSPKTYPRWSKFTRPGVSIGGWISFFTKQAKGAKLTTADDQELIDHVCTWGPAIHGHDHPKSGEAIADALAKGTSFAHPGPAEVEMAELICEVVPSVEKVRYV